MFYNTNSYLLLLIAKTWNLILNTFSFSWFCYVRTRVYYCSSTTGV